MYVGQVSQGWWTAAARQLIKNPILLKICWEILKVTDYVLNYACLESSQAKCNPRPPPPPLQNAIKKLIECLKF